ncbi:TorD/DmsD family molecular chaperone [Candidatus Thiosymbion oneisti]|uniref:TorD/DmsD family molecular chaperone n=1 Tax=Candidatus Thiosymbion oneisti TaxID=589554 RepID=UPI00105B9175|nr:molecular chaperone TorD family protein [Candidatus Thiosymbion oneisti]
MDTQNTSSPQPVRWFNKIPSSPEPVVTEKDRLSLFAQADLLQLIIRLFSLPSTETQTMLEKEVTDLQGLLQCSNLPEADHLAETFQQIRLQAQTLSLEAWVEEYHRLFEGNVACPINESGFIRRDKGAILSDIVGFYRAFGFDISQKTGEKADHLIGELEFVVILLVMLAMASEPKTTRITHEALGAFSFDHLGEWLPSFCDRLMQTTVLPIYRQLAQLLQNTWSGIVAINHLPCRERDMEALSEDGTPYECGMVDD